jgi:hypothetical protein
LTSDNAQQYADKGIIYGMYCNRDHFKTFVNSSPPAFNGITPEVIDAKHIAMFINKTVTTVPGALGVVQNRMVNNPMRTPYPLADMATEYLFRYDWTAWDQTYHGYADSWFASTTGNWTQVLAHSNVLMPLGVQYLRVTVREMLQLKEFHIVACLMVIQNTNFFDRALYSALDHNGDEFRQGTNFVLCARNHPCFPIQYSARLEDIATCFSYSQLPPDVGLDTTGPLFPNTPDLDAYAPSARESLPVLASTRRQAVTAPAAL